MHEYWLQVDNIYRGMYVLLDKVMELCNPLCTMMEYLWVRRFYWAKYSVQN